MSKIPFAAVVIESVPNLNPCDELLLDAVDPKLKPEVVLLAAEPLVEVTPNLKPPPGAMLPRGLEVVLVSFLTSSPGFVASQQTHLSFSASFATIQILKSRIEKNYTSYNQG